MKAGYWTDGLQCDLTNAAWWLLAAAIGAADDEGLLPWAPEDADSALQRLAPQLEITRIPDVMQELAAEWAVLPYTAGRERRKLGWVVSMRPYLDQPSFHASKLPPPSIQNDLVWGAYKHRDRFSCHLCGGLVNNPGVPQVINAFDYQPTGDRRLNPSLDHVIPRILGGSDYPSNVKLAHDTCNKARRERPIGATPSQHAPDLRPVRA